MNSKTQIMMVVVASVVISGGLGFYGGTIYQKNQRATSFRQFTNGGQGMVGGNRQFGGNNNPRGGGFMPVNGEVTSVDETGITVKLPDGSSKLVILSDKTTFTKSGEANKTDIKVGEKVLVLGSANSSGQVTATNISIGEVGFGMMRGGNPNASPKPVSN